MTLAASFVASMPAQQKPPVTRADYGQWETLSVNPRSALSPDGAWLAYGINRGDSNNELRVKNLADDTEEVTPFGAQAVFSSNSAWLAFSIGHSTDEQERLRRERQPVQNQLGLRHLSTGETTSFEGVQNFSFSGDGKFLAMRRYRPAAAGAATPAPGGGGAGRGGGRGGGADGAPEPVGVTVIVRNLATGTDTTFGNVSDYAWEDADNGHLLAISISADSQTGNGVHLFDPETTILRVLDSQSATYSGRTWRENARDLIALRSQTDDRHDDPTHVALVWRGVNSTSEQRLVLDPTTAASFPAGMRTVTFRSPSWSDDGELVFMGIADWKEKPEPTRGRGGRGGRQGGRGTGAPDADETGDRPAARDGAATPAPDEPADVAIWHWKDTTVMSAQQISANRDRQRNLLGVWHLDDGHFVQLGQSFDESVSVVDGQPFAYVEDWSSYAMAHSFGRRTADLYLADLSTGARTALRTRVFDGYAQVSPGGHYLLFVEDGHYWTQDLATNTVTNITRGIRTSFVDTESDSTAEPRPMFGSAGWMTDDKTVLLYDMFDIWQVAADGSASRRLTNGTTDGLRHRLVRMDFTEPAISPGIQFVSLFGVRSKQSGYGRLTIGGPTVPEPRVERLILSDQSISSLGKAADAGVYGWVAQRHDDSPDLFISSSGDLSDARQVTHTNAFQADYAWSRSEVIDYKSEKGLDLQGALYYPAGYVPGRAYPMIVYVYEQLSDSVHRYVAPSETSYYNTSVFTANGYFVLQPDIVFRPREPGLSVVESVRPAVKKVVDMGLADVRRVGIIGHSWGGFDTAFLATHTNTFAAAVAGAAITNLVSNYGNGHWSSGIAETDHIETGQQRMVVPLYEDLDAYVRNSAVYNVHNMTTPLMLETGDNDGTVFWHQAVEMYNIGRRAGKNIVMLVYAGEDHGLRQRKNQIDYQQRILTWFGHYLKGEEAPAWVTDGQAFLAKR
jgi:dipeptidyl aminopeptidase/acylaminoacyl peptidase